MLKFILSKNAVKAVGQIVGNIFARAKKRFLGKELGPKQIRFQVVTKPLDHRHDLSLRGLFEAATRAEGMPVNEKLYRSIENGVESYFDAHQKVAEAKVLNALQSYLHDAESGKAPIDPENVLGEVLEDVMGKVTEDVAKVVSTEGMKAANYSTLDAITRMTTGLGETEAVVYFSGPNDGHTCDDCKRLFFMPDGITPRCWYVSELKNGYFKKGEQHPCVGALHPNCFTGSMNLLTDSGYKTFYDLIGKTNSVNVLVDGRIKNINNVPGDVCFDDSGTGNKTYTASMVYSTGEKECLRFTFDNGCFLEVSKDHEMWVDGERVFAKNIKEKDVVPLYSSGFIKIDKIEDIGVKPTYCITEPMTNSVTVNGVVTGQCRHFLCSVLKGYGFQNGKLTFIEPGFDVIKQQRG
jgi:hypothetical protein